MTVSKEKARQFWSELGYGSTDPLGQMRANFCADAMANFADSFAAELQKENARLEKALLEKALGELLNVAEKYGIFTNHIESAEIATSLALSGARSALNPPKSGAVQKGLSDKETP